MEAIDATYANDLIDHGDDHAPEMRLVRHVLYQAIMDATAPTPGKNNMSRRRQVVADRIDARDWLYSQSDEPWSAQWCATIIDHDLPRLQHLLETQPGALRTAIMGFNRHG